MVLLKFLPFIALLCPFLGRSQDSITIAVAPAYDSVSGFHRFLFGENYRKEWATPVKLRVIRISTEKGGLTIKEKGGGLQTKSIRLTDPNGKEWVIRSIQKYPERGLPPNLRKSIAKDILQDQVVTSHPFAALTVPPLAKALELEHHNPEIIYVADEPALGEFRSDFGNAVMMLEERQPLHFEKTINTEKLQEGFDESRMKSIDARKLLRARLLDLVIGDWDRHEDQWRWAEEKENVYTAIPKDRDKVFYTTSGLFPRLLSRQSSKANLQGFLPTVQRINQYNYNNRFFDRYFISGLNEQDWKEQINLVTSRLTDVVIENAVRQFPADIFKLSGEKIITILKQRRDNLETYALPYFYALSNYIDVPGSLLKEIFLLEYITPGQLKVEVRNAIDSQLIFKRILDEKTTKEVRFYGQGGSDIFRISGDQKSRIKVFIVGGKGIDQFEIASNVINKRRIHIFDNENEENLLPQKGLYRNRLSDDSTVHTYNKKNFIYDRSGPFINAFFNLDLGLTIGAGIVEQRQGFRKDPYASRHVLSGNYSISRQAFMFNYDVHVKEVFGKNDLLIHFNSRGPKNVSNFFGLGNNSVFPNTTGKHIEHYRNRYDVMNASLGLARDISKYFTIKALAGIQFYNADLSDNRDRYLSEFNSKFPDENVFDERVFGGFITGFQFNSTDNSLLPDKGLNWRATLTSMRQFGGTRSEFTKIESDMTFYAELSRREAFVVANRLGGGMSFGDPAFFQQFNIGGPANLRGYVINRFTGSSAFYHNIEARLKLFDFNSYLFPGTVGMTTFHDIGRVWARNESSSTWHRGYGGGLFVMPADLLVVQFLMAWSKEGRQPYISLGMSF